MLQFSKGIIFIFLVFVSTTLFCGNGYAQTSNWLALSNGIGQSIDLEIDKKGSVYTLGRESREIEFRSVDSLGPTHHSNVPWHGQFVTKHTAEGELSFVLHFISVGGNSETTSARDMIVLNDNRLAVGVYCGQKYQVIDSRGDSIQVEERSSSLIIFKENGQFDTAIPLPLNYAQWLFQTDNGELYAIGGQRSYGTSRYTTICKINLLRNEAKAVEEKISRQFTDVIAVGNTLWFLDVEVTKSEYYYQHKTYQLSRLVTGSRERETIQTYEFGLCRKNDAELIQSEGVPQIVFRVEAARSTGVDLNEIVIPYVKDYVSWLFMDTSGKLVKKLLVDCIAKSESVERLKSGGYLMRYIVYDTLQIEGEETILVPKHKPFVYELCFVKLSPNFKVEEVIFSGGIGDANQASFKVKDDFLYVSGFYYEDNVIDGILRKLSWSHGYFVRKRQLETKP